MDEGDYNEKNLSLIFTAIILLTSTPLKISSIDEKDIDYTNTSVDSNYSEINTELEIGKEIVEHTKYLESIENSKIKASARSLQYTINGYKEPYEYVIGTAIVTWINFNVKLTL